MFHIYREIRKRRTFAVIIEPKICIVLSSYASEKVAGLSNVRERDYMFMYMYICFDSHSAARICP